MPTRMIREGLLDSDRYWAVTIEARQLFWHLMLLADDFGCVSLAPALIRRRCFDDGPSQDKVDRLITQLMDVDLIRVYVANDVRYAFIPRFQQRLKRLTLKHPEPPPEILHGDGDARAKFQRIKGELGVPAAGGQPEGRPPAPEVEVEVEVKRSEKTPAASPPSVFDLGVAILCDQGSKESSARSFIGSLLKEWDEPTVEDAVRASLGTDKAKAYILGVLRKKPKKGALDAVFAGAR